MPRDRPPEPETAARKEAAPEGEAPSRHGSNRDRRADERRIWRMAFLISLALHLLIFLVGPRGSVPISPFAAAGPRAADSEAAEGAMESVALRSAPPDALRPITIPQVEVPMPEPEELDPESTLDVELTEPERPDPGEGSTEGRDPDEEGDAGLPDATGEGDAGTVAEGRSRVVPPTPRGMIMPPTNRDLRGTEVEIWVFVNERGRVVPDSTRLEPPTRDRRYNEELIRQAAEWVFEPARREGEPVAAWFPYRISM